MPEANTEENMNTPKIKIERKLPDPEEIQREIDRIKEEEAIEIKKIKERSAKRLKKERTRLRKARDSSLFVKGAAFEKLGLLEVEYYVVLGLLEEHKEDLVSPASVMYKEWFALGKHIYGEMKKNKKAVDENE